MGHVCLMAETVEAALAGMKKLQAAVTQKA
jgi:hypothetical protein